MPNKCARLGSYTCDNQILSRLTWFLINLEKSLASKTLNNQFINFYMVTVNMKSMSKKHIDPYTVKKRKKAC